MLPLSRPASRTQEEHPPTEGLLRWMGREPPVDPPPIDVGRGFLPQREPIPRGPISLGGSMASSSVEVLATRVRAIHAHFNAYFKALDLAAGHDVCQILAPGDWRSPLEKPFLFLGDFHPSLFTNLRSLIDPSFCSPSAFSFSLAWEQPSEDLTALLGHIERGIRLIVPSLVRRLRDSQTAFIEGAAEEWAAARRRGEASPEVPVEVLTDQVREIECVFAEANRLRRSILREILAATNVYQGALFVEGLSNFVIGFGDEEMLLVFERSKIPLSSLSL